MKTNVTRILCLALVLLMSVAVFVGCSKDPVTETDVTNTDVTSVPEDIIVDITDKAYEIVKDANGKDIVILTKDGFNVAENTTLEAFLACVVAEEGYSIKVLDAQGKELTDTKAIVANGMVFELYKDGVAEAEEKQNIIVVAASVIESAIQEQSKIDQEKSEILNPSKDDSKDESKDKTPTKAFDIVLNTVYHGSYTGSDATSKAYQNAMAAMKKKGINTTINPLDAASATDTLVKENMAGKPSADIYEISQVMCRNVAKKGAAVNLYSSSTLNKSLFKCAGTECVTFNGKAYGVTWASKSVSPMGVIYNKDLVAKYAPTYDIVKLYNDKKWNFDNFQAIAKACTVDTDGNGKSDIYGFTSNTNVIGMALTSNAGGTALKVNEKVEATMCNEAGIKALEWCKEMFKTDKSWLYKADINQCVTEFCGGKAAMFVSYFHYYGNIAAQANFKLGFVLMPMGPAQSSYCNGVYDNAYYVVPTHKANRLDDIGTWLNNVASSTSSVFLNNKVKDVAKNGFDSTSQAVFKWVVNNMTPEFSSGVFSSAISSEVDSSVTSAAKQPAKVMASIKTKAQKECDDYYAEIYDLSKAK
ncbi:MAG: hypothetical protein IJP35_03790 [Clostridia bacterium]|nr:hypothetical protein [Clostridia bacterium]